MKRREFRGHNTDFSGGVADFGAKTAGHYVVDVAPYEYSGGNVRGEE